MSCGENKAVVSRFVEEFWSQGNTAAADELMTADAAIFLLGRGQVSKESFKAFAMTLRGAFPDWYSIQEELIAQDDRVAERWTGRGTHQGGFLGVPPTGRQVAVPGFVFYRLTSGKIAEFRGLFDGLSMLQQLVRSRTTDNCHPSSGAREEQPSCLSTHCAHPSCRTSKPICMAN